MRYSTIADRTAGTGSAEKWAIHYAARERAARGESIIEMTIGEPDVPPSPRIIDHLCERVRAGRVKYATLGAEDAFLNALARKYSRRTAREISAKNCLYVPGTQAALFTVMQVLVQEGDEVLVPDPYYATYDGTIRAAGAEVVSVPLRYENRFHLRVQDLQQAITPRSRVLVLNSPHNPTGAALSATELYEVGMFCSKHDLWIVSDEVYESLCYVPFASPFDIPDLAERTIVISSISKSHALPGLRCGWCVGPLDACKRITAIADSIYFGSQPFLRDTTAFAIDNDFPETRQLHDSLKNRAAIASGILGRSRALRCHVPEGGMFCMVDISRLAVKSLEFAWRLLEQEKVAVMPGASFGRFSDGLLRVCLTVPEVLLRTACKRIVRLAESLEQRAVEEFDLAVRS
jgi:arginine:pyruvate transaminase